jgi:hypothetical protein
MQNKLIKVLQNKLISTLMMLSAVTVTIFQGYKNGQAVYAEVGAKPYGVEAIIAFAESVDYVTYGLGFECDIFVFHHTGIFATCFKDSQIINEEIR